MNENQQQTFEDFRRKHDELIADVEAGKPVPAVDPEDLKKLWSMRDTSGRQSAIAIGALQAVGLHSMDDVPIIGFRAMLLEMLLRTGMLKPFEADSKAEDAALRVAATFPLVFSDPKKPDGTLLDTFDVAGFMKQVQAAESDQTTA